jgi:hypothetical protein
MRAVATKEVGREHRGRTALGRLFIGVAAVLVSAEWGCGSGGGAASVLGPDGGEAALSPSTPHAVSVAGTWRGAGDTLRLSWRLSQEGESVSGTSQVAGDGGWSAREGLVVGKVSGSSFSFNDTHASGSSTTASCSAELEGTLELHEMTQVVPPQPPYPSGYPINPPKTVTRTLMSGLVEGSACGTPFSGMVTLFRD